MANSDKNIIITPNTGGNDEPTFQFIGAGNSSISLKVPNQSTEKLSFQGSAGNQIFGLDTNFIGLGQEQSNIFTVTNKSGITALGVNNNFNTTVDLCPGDGQVKVHGHNYVISACLSMTDASKSTIINNNDGYVNFELSNSNYFITDRDAIQIVSDASPYGLRFTKSGIVQCMVSQDYITSGSTGYTYAGFYVNGANPKWHLITNTNGQWDGFVFCEARAIKAGDILTARMLGSDITAIDRGAWSYWNFLFHAVDF